MPKPTKGPRLGGSASHQKLILANLASQLFEHGRVTTTVTRARRVQPLAETLITKAKRGDLHSRRLVARTIRDKEVLRHLFDDIAPVLQGRDGGCTRVTRIGNRRGDNAPMAVLEIITEPVAARTPAQGTEAAQAAAEPADEAPEAPVEEQAEAVVESAEAEDADEQAPEADGESSAEDEAAVDGQ